jgi:hypothetical protein
VTPWSGDPGVLKKEAPGLIHDRIGKIPADVDPAIDGEEPALLLLAATGVFRSPNSKWLDSTRGLNRSRGSKDERGERAIG